MHVIKILDLALFGVYINTDFFSCHFFVINYSMAVIVNKYSVQFK